MSVITLPVLSPTMETGTIAEWMVKEGDKISPGTVVCSVETDKANVDFEFQDDGYIAKILQPKGASDLPLGTVCSCEYNSSVVHCYSLFQS